MGLVHALRASAEVALGDDDSPLRAHAARDGVQGLGAAERSLGLLEMLQDKTSGNLGEVERDTLWTALRSVRARVQEARARVAGGGDNGGPSDAPGGTSDPGGFT